MSLSATRSRRSNAGNRWAEALAAAQLENGDAPDPDAELSGEEFVGKEEEDVFESDFESTDEEEYAKQGVEDGEKQVLLEERAERRAARAKASKSAAAPVQRMLDRAMRGEPAPKKRKLALKNARESGSKAKTRTGNFMWDAIRQSERASTVKHKALVQERLKDAEKRKAHAPKRTRQVAPPKTQDELIAAALELEEKNTKLLKEFLVKEEEKRAAARRVVRMKIEGPKLRWVSRGEQVRVKVLDPSEGSDSGRAAGANGSALPVTQDGTRLQAQSSGSVPQPAAIVPVLPSITTQAPATSSVSTQSQSQGSPAVQPSTLTPALGTSAQRSTASVTTERSHTPTAGRRSSTPSVGQRMQVYVELPSRPARRSASSSSPGPQTSPLFPASQTLMVPSSQPLSRSPLSLSQPLPRSPLSTSQPLLPPSSQPAPSFSQPMSRQTSASESATTHHSVSPVNTLQPPTSLDPLRRSNSIRQASVSSTSSSKSRMMMYVELPSPRKKSKTPVPRRDAENVAAAKSDPEGAEAINGGLLENKVGSANSNIPPPSTVPTISNIPTTGNIPAPSTILMGDALPAVKSPAAGSEALPKPPVSSRSTDSTLFPPGGPNFAIVLPTRKSLHKTEKQARNYVVVELGERVRAPFGKSMRAVFGDHANWEDVLVNGVKPVAQAKPICAITGLAAPYRDPRTGIPYANAYAYKTLTRLLAHEFVWSKEKGCYVGDEGRDPARGVPPNWANAAAGRF